MSTEEINQETAAPETATPPTPDPVPNQEQPAESDVNWNDVPDPEDEPNGTALSEPSDKSDPHADPDPAPASDPSDQSNSSDNQENNDDPFSFLNELDNDPPAPTDPEPADSSDASPSDKSNPPDNRETPPAPADLSGFDVAALIDGLAPGDLKDFAGNYPEETRMAAAMTLEILKKLGYDQLRSDVKKFSGAAEQFGRNQQELQARAELAAFEQALLKIHPDAKDIVFGDGKRAFASWLKNQPQFIQKRFRDTTDSEEMADVITRYKDSRSGQRSAQHKRASQFSSVRSASSAPRSRSDEDVGWNDVKDEDVPEY